MYVVMLMLLELIMSRVLIIRKRIFIEILLVNLDNLFFMVLNIWCYGLLNVEKVIVWFLLVK